jgi:hypothetical protein
VLKDPVESEHHLVMRLQLKKQWLTELAYLVLKPPAKHDRIEGQKS